MESVFFFADNRIPFGFPKTSGSFHGVVIHAQENFPLTQLQNNLKTIKEFVKQYNGLKSVIHWYIEAQQESDAWKRYFWSFQSLEIFTVKLSKEFFDTVKEKILNMKNIIINGVKKDELSAIMDPNITLKSFGKLPSSSF